MLHSYWLVWILEGLPTTTRTTTNFLTITYLMLGVIK
jgi:hypothetical protein